MVESIKIVEFFKMSELGFELSVRGEKPNTVEKMRTTLGSL